MNETSKACLRRYRDDAFKMRYFVGDGIDIGGGTDSLALHLDAFPLMKSVRTWDLPDGDAQYLDSVPDESMDFVYSSHCLEHMVDVRVALRHWLRILKPGGHLVVTVPDEDMYEHGMWPSVHNTDHKWSFCLYKASPALPCSINVLDLIREFAEEIECERVWEIRDHYQNSRAWSEDQTLGDAECAIEFVWRKKLDAHTASERLRRAYELELAQAIDFCTSMLQQDPQNFEGYNSLANMLVRQGRLAEADYVWLTCITHLPDAHIAHIFYALFLIACGRFDEGFRIRDPLVSDALRTPITPPTDYPRWQGEDLTGKSLVIWTEFGFGDEIMFARFAGVLKGQLGARSVTVVCQDPLLPLFQSLQDADAVIGASAVADLPLHNYWVFPHSIPVFYSLEKHGVPAKIPYLFSDPEKAAWAEDLLPLKTPGRRRIGVVWKGNPTHENDALRSVHDLRPFSTLFGSPDIDWISLQKGESESMLDAVDGPGVSITRLGSRLSDFGDTAAVCAQLDMVLAVDTSIVHVAGALGVPVLLMLPTYTDWRWGVNADNCPWYPGVRLFRQQRTMDWRTVAQDVSDFLRARRA